MRNQTDRRRRKAPKSPRARRPTAGDERANDLILQGGVPTTGGSAPGGETTGLRHETDLTGRLGQHVPTGGFYQTRAGGGSGVGAGGLATGPAGIGGTRTLSHGAGRRALFPRKFRIELPGVVTSETRPPGESIESGLVSGPGADASGEAGIRSRATTRATDVEEIHQRVDEEREEERRGLP